MIDADVYRVMAAMGETLAVQGIVTDLRPPTIAAIRLALANGVHPDEIAWTARFMGSARNPDAVLRTRIEDLADLPESARMMRPTPTPPNLHGAALRNSEGVPPTQAYLAARRQLNV